jgi:phosphoenolpyruvate-protein kinase (PTS system EI component)
LNKLRSDSETASVPGIFDAQRAMIEESSLLEKVAETIAAQKVNAEWAVKIVTDGYIAKYKSIADEHLRDRYIDVEDVADRILNALGGGERAAPLAKDSIIVAQELMPSTLAEQSGNHPTASDHGARRLDLAYFILAREMNLPAVTGVKKVLRRVTTGDAAIVDGYNGNVILNPSCGDTRAIPASGCTIPANKLQRCHCRRIAHRDAGRKGDHPSRECRSARDLQTSKTDRSSRHRSLSLGISFQPLQGFSDREPAVRSVSRDRRLCR